MKKTEGNRMTMDQENRIIRKCDHVKSIGAMAVYVDTGCRSANMIKGVMVSSRRRCFNEHDRHTKAARRQMNHQPYQADFRSHIMGRFERVE